MDFVRCSYLGQHSADGRRFDGLGRYTFTNGDVYIGGMQDGRFHGHGVIFFSPPPPPSSSSGGGDVDLQTFLNSTSSDAVSLVAAGGGGQYRGVWQYGRHVEGQYVFQDGLVYGTSGTADMSAAAQRARSTSWTYCHGSDRRLWEEYLQNVAPVLPHEALLGGAKLLHARKHAMAAGQAEGGGGGGGGDASSAAAAAAVQDGDGAGEGLPMVLPRAFVLARAAPAFARGQLTSVDDPRVTRWAAAAEAHELAVRHHHQQQHGQATTSPPASPGRRTTQSGHTSSGAEASPEVIESTIALQFAMAVPTEGLRADGRLDDDVATDATAAETVAADMATARSCAAPPPSLNLAVCRVLDVADVNRSLVQVFPAP
ncbi:MORN repeat [Novymonas esmeraldas]|uniref:MORN repeat-containing protein 5 n=1 Tax=Novymonas esmeraldas TaxID=1808958 RepID=A0AAW0EZL9_9TRYP